MNKLQQNLYCAFVMTAIATLGCSKGDSTGAVVQGNVTIDGILASRGTVTFHPIKQGPVAIGQIHSDGSYSLRTGLGKSASPDDAKIKAGKYVVTVMVMGDPPQEELKKEDGSPPTAGPRLTSIKYASKETSGLEFEVTPGVNLIPLELEGSANDPPPEQQQEEGAEESQSLEEAGEGATEPAVEDAPKEAASDTESKPASEEVE